MPARNTQQTGAKTAKAASKVLTNPTSSKAEKSAAATALSQIPSAAAEVGMPATRVAGIFL